LKELVVEVFSMSFSLIRRAGTAGLLPVFLFLAVLFASPVAPSRTVFAQGAQPQSDLSAQQRLSVMRTKLEAMRRSLTSAIAAMNSSDKSKDKNPDDPRERLRGIDKEVGSVLTEVSEIQGKEERAEKYDPSRLPALETSVSELNARVEAALQSTASARVGEGTPNYRPKEKNKRRLFGLLPGKKNDKYEELTGT